MATWALRILIAIASVIFRPHIATAQQEPGDRVLAEEALPPDVGEWELRVSGDFTRRVRTFPRVQLFFGGPIERLGGELAVSATHESSEYRWSSIEVGAKWLAFGAMERMPSIVIGTEAEWDRDDGETRTALYPYLAVLREFPRFALQATAGPVIRLGETEDGDDYGFAFDSAAVVPLGARLSAIGEAGRDDEWGTYVSPGLRLELTERASVAAEVPLLFNEPHYRFVVQGQIRFGR